MSVIGLQCTDTMGRFSHASEEEVTENGNDDKNDNNKLEENAQDGSQSSHSAVQKNVGLVPPNYIERRKMTATLSSPPPPPPPSGRTTKTIFSSSRKAPPRGMYVSRGEGGHASSRSSSKRGSEMENSDGGGNHKGRAMSSPLLFHCRRTRQAVAAPTTTTISSSSNLTSTPPPPPPPCWPRSLFRSASYLAASTSATWTAPPLSSSCSSRLSPALTTRATNKGTTAVPSPPPPALVATGTKDGAPAVSARVPFHSYHEHPDYHHSYSYVCPYPFPCPSPPPPNAAVGVGRREGSITDCWSTSSEVKMRPQDDPLALRAGSKSIGKTDMNNAEGLSSEWQAKEEEEGGSGGSGRLSSSSSVPLCRMDGVPTACTITARVMTSSPCLMSQGSVKNREMKEIFIPNERSGDTWVRDESPVGISEDESPFDLPTCEYRDGNDHRDPPPPMGPSLVNREEVHHQKEEKGEKVVRLMSNEMEQFRTGNPSEEARDKSSNTFIQHHYKDVGVEEEEDRKNKDAKPERHSSSSSCCRVGHPSELSPGGAFSPSRASQSVAFPLMAAVDPTSRPSTTCTSTVTPLVSPKLPSATTVELSIGRKNLNNSHLSLFPLSPTASTTRERQDSHRNEDSTPPPPPPSTAATASFHEGILINERREVETYCTPCPTPDLPVMPTLAPWQISALQGGDRRTKEVAHPSLHAHAKECPPPLSTSYPIEEGRREEKDVVASAVTPVGISQPFGSTFCDCTLDESHSFSLAGHDPSSLSPTSASSFASSSLVLEEPICARENERNTSQKKKKLSNHHHHHHYRYQSRQNISPPSCTSISERFGFVKTVFPEGMPRESSDKSGREAAATTTTRTTVVVLGASTEPPIANMVIRKAERKDCHPRDNNVDDDDKKENVKDCNAADNKRGEEAVEEEQKRVKCRGSLLYLKKIPSLISRGVHEKGTSSHTTSSFTSCEAEQDNINNSGSGSTSHNSPERLSLNETKEAPHWLSSKDEDKKDTNERVEEMKASRKSSARRRSDAKQEKGRIALRSGASCGSTGEEAMRSHRHHPSPTSSIVPPYPIPPPTTCVAMANDERERPEENEDVSCEKVNVRQEAEEEEEQAMSMHKIKKEGQNDLGKVLSHSNESANSPVPHLFTPLLSHSVLVGKAAHEVCPPPALPGPGVLSTANPPNKCATTSPTVSPSLSSSPFRPPPPHSTTQPQHSPPYVLSSHSSRSAYRLLPFRDSSSTSSHSTRRASTPAHPFSTICSVGTGTTSSPSLLHKCCSSSTSSLVSPSSAPPPSSSFVSSPKRHHLHATGHQLARDEASPSRPSSSAGHHQHCDSGSGKSEENQGRRSSTSGRRNRHPMIHPSHSHPPYLLHQSPPIALLSPDCGSDEDAENRDARTRAGSEKNHHDENSLTQCEKQNNSHNRKKIRKCDRSLQVRAVESPGSECSGDQIDANHHHGLPLPLPHKNNDSNENKNDCFLSRVGIPTKCERVGNSEAGYISANRSSPFPHREMAPTLSFVSTPCCAVEVRSPSPPSTPPSSFLSDENEEKVGETKSKKKEHKKKGTASPILMLASEKRTVFGTAAQEMKERELMESGAANEREGRRRRNSRGTSRVRLLTTPLECTPLSPPLLSSNESGLRYEKEEDKTTTTATTTSCTTTNTAPPPPVPAPPPPPLTFINVIPSPTREEIQDQKEVEEGGRRGGERSSPFPPRTQSTSTASPLSELLDSTQRETKWLASPSSTCADAPPTRDHEEEVEEEGRKAKGRKVSGDLPAHVDDLDELSSPLMSPAISDCPTAVGGHHLVLKCGRCFLKESGAPREERFYEQIRPFQERLVRIAASMPLGALSACHNSAGWLSSGRAPVLDSQESLVTEDKEERGRGRQWVHPTTTITSSSPSSPSTISSLSASLLESKMVLPVSKTQRRKQWCGSHTEGKSSPEYSELIHASSSVPSPDPTRLNASLPPLTAPPPPPPHSLLVLPPSSPPPPSRCSPCTSSASSFFSSSLENFFCLERGAEQWWKLPDQCTFQSFPASYASQKGEQSPHWSRGPSTSPLAAVDEAGETAGRGVEMITRKNTPDAGMATSPLPFSAYLAPSFSDDSSVSRGENNNNNKEVTAKGKVEGAVKQKGNDEESVGESPNEDVHTEGYTNSAATSTRVKMWNTAQSESVKADALRLMASFIPLYRGKAIVTTGEVSKPTTSCQGLPSSPSPLSTTAFGPSNGGEDGEVSGSDPVGSQEEVHGSALVSSSQARIYSSGIKENMPEKFTGENPRGGNRSSTAGKGGEAGMDVLQHGTSSSDTEETKLPSWKPCAGTPPTTSSSFPAPVKPKYSIISLEEWKPEDQKSVSHSARGITSPTGDRNIRYRSFTSGTDDKMQKLGLSISSDVTNAGVRKESSALDFPCALENDASSPTKKVEEIVDETGSRQTTQRAFSPPSRPLLLSSPSVEVIVLEDVCHGFQYPCVLDMKMGKRQYGLRASEKKKQSKTMKANMSTSGKYGIRLAGYRKFDMETQTYHSRGKLECRYFNLEKLHEELSYFLNRHRALAFRFREQLERLRFAFSLQRVFRFFTSSLLFVYDAVNSLETARVVMVDFAFTYERQELQEEKDEDAAFDYDVGYIKALDTLLSLLA